MAARLTFLAITAFWVTMNLLLWRAEYGSHGDETPVPVQFVWRKILTAPDASSLSVYQKGERTGYCEFSTGVGQEMAALDLNKLPPEGLMNRASYQIHLAGNLAFGDFTNRVKFDGRIQFSKTREWSELTLQVSAHGAQIQIRAQATNPVVQVTVTTEDGVLRRNLPVAGLQNPTLLAREFLGGFAGPALDALNLPDFQNLADARKIEWTACRTRVKIGAEPVPVYRLETFLLGRQVTVEVSTLGEVLRVRLPGEWTAQIDEWGKP